MNLIHNYHRFLFSIFVLFVLFLDLFFSKILQQHENIIFISLVLLIGYPHGSFDYYVGKNIFSKKYPKIWLALFIITYLIIVAIFVQLWFLNPGFLLIFFLIISIYHFGSEDYITLNHKNFKIFNIFFRGLIPIITPYVFYYEKVNFYFNILSNNNIFLFNHLSFYYLSNIFLFVIVFFYFIMILKDIMKFKKIFLKILNHLL